MYINPELIDELKRSKVILFVGAGVSANLGLPSWSELINHMAQELDFDPKTFRSYGDFLELAEYYEIKERLIGPASEVGWMSVFTIQRSRSRNHGFMS